MANAARRYGCSHYQEQSSAADNALNIFATASEIDVLKVVFENAPGGHCTALFRARRH
jgi:hypothetical protein